MNLKFVKIFLFSIMVSLLTMGLLTHCNTAGCTDNRSSLLLTGFYSSTTLRAISVDSLELGGVGAPNDSLLVTIDERASQVYLPLRSRDTETSFYLHYASKNLNDPAFDDVIILRYTSEPYFASEECGAMYRYHIHELRYTRHLIDSIALPDSLINNANVERMKIFFRTETSQ